MLWIEEAFSRCPQVSDCTDAEQFNFSGRCNEMGHCEYRPNDIYRVLLYPREIEFVISPDDESP